MLVRLYMTFLLSMVYKGFFNGNSCATFRGMKCNVTGIGVPTLTIIGSLNIICVCPSFICHGFIKCQEGLTVCLIRLA